jgi:hypothetical protein
MERGDLATWTRPRYVIVIEGVFCSVTLIEEQRFMRKPKTTGWHAQWYDIPLKRLCYMKSRWPGTAADLVTFVSMDFCDEAADFLDTATIPYDTIRYQPLDQFTNTIRYQQDLQAIYDSDQGRLDRFGQLGRSVMPGEDF